MKRTLAQSTARFDIELLRAFAVLVVMLYHAGIQQIQAGFIGVDVFFVISGYLIIGLLHKEWLETGRVQLARFWGRRARRLLPAATVVIIVTAIASWLLAGRLIQNEIRIDLLAAALYISNLRFGLSGTDYWASNYISPALHFWSLGVEEQFYIVTPILIAVFALVARKPKPNSRIAIIALSCIAATSFAYCIYLVQNDAVWAYYQPLARAWEFALGGIAAVAPTSQIRREDRLLSVFLWPALFSLVLVLDSQAGWPNATTAIPVLLTVALLRVSNPQTVEGALQTDPLKVKRLAAWIGGISYGAYLWHWPLFWIAASLQRVDSPTALPLNTSLPLLLLTLLLADLSKRFIEDPIRFSRFLMNSNLRSLTVGWTFSAISVGAVLVTLALPAYTLLPPPPKLLPTQVAPTTPASPTEYQVWLEQMIAKFVPNADKSAQLEQALPTISNLRSDKPESTSSNCYTDKNSTEVPTDCFFGNLKSKTTIAILGDSHAEQYFGGVVDAAWRLGLRVLLLTKPSCPAPSVNIFLYHEQRPYPECVKFHAAAMAKLLEVKPALVITSSMVTQSIIDPETDSLANRVRGAELWRIGYAETISNLTSAGIRVLVVRDVPDWGFDVADCLATYQLADCSSTPKLADPADDIEIAKAVVGARALDLTNAICAENECFPIRAQSIVVRDNTHISRTYSHVLGMLWRVVLQRELAEIR